MLLIKKNMNTINQVLLVVLTPFLFISCGSDINRKPHNDERIILQKSNQQKELREIIDKKNIEKIIISDDKLFEINNFIKTKYELIQINSIKVLNENNLSYIITYDMNKNILEVGPIGESDFIQSTDYIEDIILYKLKNILNPKINHIIFNRMINGKKIDIGNKTSIIKKNSRTKKINSHKLVFLNPGHGLTRADDGGANSWRYQRELYFDVQEDEKTIEIVSKLYPKLINNISVKVARPLEDHSNLSDIPKTLDSELGDSGYLMYLENARQFIKKIIPDKTNIWNKASSGKYEDKDINSRPWYSNYLNSNLMVSIHTNGSNLNIAGVCIKKGTNVYYAENSFKNESKEFGSLILNNITQKIQKDYKSDWGNGSLISKNHAENRLSNNPSVIIEVAYHDCFSDAQALKDTKFINIVTEAMAESINSYTRESYFDSVGSLVNQNNDCWGCQHDEAVMHPHNLPSTVAFQWTASSKCNNLKVGIAKNKDSGEIGDEALDVIVKTKDWKHKTIENTYKTTLPITIDKTSYWNTTAITSLHKINSTKRIIAECTNTKINSQKEIIKENLLKTHDGYFWGGNGSLIIRDNPKQNIGGKKDYALSYQNKKSLSIFQWQTSSSCNKLNLHTNDNKNINVDNIKIKYWSDKEWKKWKPCNNKLPCTIDFSSLNNVNHSGNYYLVKIENKSNSFSANTIIAECN